MTSFLFSSNFSETNSAINSAQSVQCSNAVLKEGKAPPHVLSWQDRKGQDKTGYSTAFGGSGQLQALKARAVVSHYSGLRWFVTEL